MQVLWKLLPKSLLPIPLSGIRQFLDKFVLHLQRPRASARPRQIDRMREAFRVASAFA